MHSRRTTTEHQEIVSRRLAQLSEQLRDPVVSPPALAPASGDDWWDDHTHVAVRRPGLVLVPAETPLGPPPDLPPSPTRSPTSPTSSPPRPPPRPPSPVPVPGRHASRRARAGVPSLVPSALRGRVVLGAGQLTVVAVLVALGLAATTWWVVRGDPEPATQQVVAGAVPDDLVALPDQEVSAAPPPGSSASGAPVVATEITVDVAGKVRRPGIVVLGAGTRVVDAIRSAGGARPGVDLTSINLARPLVDGEQILVGVPGGAAVPPGSTLATGPPGSTTGTSPTVLVDLNLASQTDLEALPEVGPVTATSIIAWRDEHGGFSAVDELLEVDGIGEATLAQLSPLVTV